jgi:hypothetical protein
LQRCIASFSPRARLFTIRGVKIDHIGGRGRPLEKRIQAPAIQRRPAIRLIKASVLAHKADWLPNVTWLVRFHAFTSNR